jgi:tRNA pseudouridine38-40 synthase
MRNLRLLIEYDGSNYLGWQIQNHRNTLAVGLKARHQRRSDTIQETIEEALYKILHEKVGLIVSGRTDAGAHAYGQVANFKTRSRIPCEKLKAALNAILPEDITVMAVSEAPLKFHSRFCAKSKVYRYTIHSRAFSSPLLPKNVYFCRHPLDVKLMRRETQVILGRHNFKSFCASGSKVKDMVRTVKKISVSTLDAQSSTLKSHSLIVIDIEADGFLYNMVRNIVGTLIDIGRGRFPKGSMKRILEAKDRRSAGPAAPACGLCLMEVRY